MVGARFSRASLLTNALVLMLAAPAVVPGVEAAPTVIFEDDFNDGVIDTTRWATVGAVENDDCGANSAPYALKFDGSTRSATTVPVDVSLGGTIEFFLSNGVLSPCEIADGVNENVLLQYSTNAGTSWTAMATYPLTAFQTFVQVVETIPSAAQSISTQFRWLQPSNSGTCCDHWAIDDVRISTGKLVDPVSQTIPGDSESQTIPSQSLDTPPVTTPATCTLGPCTIETPVGTPDVPIPHTCTPLDLVCVGPGNIPGQHLTDVPAVCDAAGFACIPSQSIPSEHLGDTPEVTVAVDFTGLDVFADPHAGELTTIGPFVVDLGFFPVTLCASTCPFPVPPEGSTLGSVTVTVTIDGTEHSQTVPLEAST